MPGIDDKLAWADENLDQSIARLFALVRIASISTDPATSPSAARPVNGLSMSSQPSASMLRCATPPASR